MSQLVQSILSMLSDLGYIGIAFGLMIEIIPSEIVLAYGGFLISKGDITFTGAVIAGTIGGVIAQWIIYGISRYGGRPIVEKYGKYILIRPRHLELAQDWFERYGAGVIFTARFIPVVRHAISIPAGIAKMAFSRFSLYTVLAIIPWSVLFLYLGYTLGANYQQINQAAQPYVRPAIIVATLFVLSYIIIKWKRKKQEDIKEMSK